MITGAVMLFVIPAILILGVIGIIVSLITAVLTGLINGFFDAVGKAIDKVGSDKK